MGMLEAWEEFSRANGCEPNKLMRACFFAGYAAGSEHQMEHSREGHERTIDDLRRYVQAEVAMAQGAQTGRTQ